MFCENLNIFNFFSNRDSKHTHTDVELVSVQLGAVHERRPQSGGGVDQCGQFANKEKGGQFFADVF